MKTPKSSMKSVKKTVKGLMQDKNVLYVVAFLAFMNILGYLAKQNGEAVIFFLIVGFLTTYFSKNMIVVLITAMVAANLFVMSRMTFIKKEGMTNGNDDSDSAGENADDDDDDDESDHDNERQPIGASASTKKKKASLKKSKYQNEYENENTATEGLAMPASESQEEGEEDYATVPSDGGDHIDYSKTLESAYGNLEKILGQGGMKDISKTTQQLMEQQKLLMDNMNQMAPMMKAAEGFMEKVGGGNLGGLIGGMLGGNNK